jgi:hypothetical protein
VRDEAVDNASGAALKAGAGQKAAGGSQCAATVKLTDAALRVTRGYVVFKGPARELRWNDSDEARLVVAPEGPELDPGAKARDREGSRARQG